MEQNNRQELFNHMSSEHGLTLLDSELNEIYSICIGYEEYVKMLNFSLTEPTIQAELEKELQTSLNHFNAMTLAMFELEKAKELLRWYLDWLNKGDESEYNNEILMDMTNQFFEAK